jgi:hypothetical protein
MDFEKYVHKLPYGTKKDSPEVYQAYQEEAARLFAAFYEDALKEVGLTDHPKAAKAFNLAYQQGHANGFNEIFLHLCDIANVLL